MLEVNIDNKAVEIKPESSIDSVVTGIDLLREIKPSQKIVAMKHSGSTFDLTEPLPKTGSVELVSTSSSEGLEIIRHSTAHVLAQAVKQLFPTAQVTIGPVIENGFYYDFDFERAFTEDDLKVIEKQMKKIIRERIPLVREEWTSDQAIKYFGDLGEKYKCEIIKDLGESKVSIYKQGDFTDLCRGTHVPHTGVLSAFKLMKVAGAYWRGDEKNTMLTRIYGTAFANKDELKEYLNRLEEAKKRDHRKIGVQMDLFSFHPEAPASPFFHPRGSRLYRNLSEFIHKVNDVNNYDTVRTPLLMSEEMWKTSGHYENYRENMYFSKVDDRDFALKPMNCPGHVLIYKSKKISYRNLPLKYAEFGRVHRHERSGVTAGLFRVRSFVQDDAHIFCTENQIEDEINKILKIIDFVYKAFDFSFKVELSTRPEKRIGSDEVWDMAENALKNSLEKSGLEYQLNPGDGAFYGPKIDFHLQDSIGRTHQCGTVQLDFSMPERFGLTYTSSEDTEKTPVMIHRAIIGSFERFLGILIEHFEGKFPFWLAPEQVAIMTISNDQRAYALEIAEKLQAKGYKVIVDDSSEKISYKIRKYQLLKVPYMLPIGSKEMESKVLSIRDLSGKQRHGVSFEELINELQNLQMPIYKSFPNNN